METIASILVVSFLSVLVVDARHKRREFLRKKKI
jgi:hypothetical protein